MAKIVFFYGWLNERWVHGCLVYFFLEYILHRCGILKKYFIIVIRQTSLRISRSFSLHVSLWFSLTLFRTPGTLHLRSMRVTVSLPNVDYALQVVIINKDNIYVRLFLEVNIWHQTIAYVYKIVQCDNEVHSYVFVSFDTAIYKLRYFRNQWK